VLAAVALAGCTTDALASDLDGVEPRNAQSSRGVPNGAACTRARDCRSGVCEGRGCGPGGGRCVSAGRGCPRDHAAYCGCDGRVFYASGGCPNARYRYAGLCNPIIGGRGSPITVHGALDRIAVQRVVRSRLGALAFCAEQARQSQPDAHGRVVLQLVVDGTGAVISATISSGPTTPPALGMCVAGQARRWQFPRPSDGGNVQIEIPVTFDEVSGG